MNNDLRSEINETGFKPCPFCGSANDLDVEFEKLCFEQTAWFVECSTCGTQGPCVVAGKGHRAKEFWNNRKEPPKD